MRILLYTLFVGIFCVLVQMQMPGIEFLGGARPRLTVLGVIYAAICLRGLRVFIVSLVIGFYIDLLCQNRLGVSVISLSFAAALILTQTSGRIIQRVDFQMLLVLVSSFLYMSLDYIFYLMQTWNTTSTPGDWVLITYGSLLNALLSPILFALFNLPLRLVGWKPSTSEEYSGYAAQ